MTPPDLHGYIVFFIRASRDPGPEPISYSQVDSGAERIGCLGADQ